MQKNSLALNLLKKQLAILVEFSSRPLSRSRSGSYAMSVTVLIVNWNSVELLAECLLHLERQTDRPTRVFVIPPWRAFSCNV